MASRRIHSSIDRLPKALRDSLMRMVIDNEWPADFPRNKAFGFKDGNVEPAGIPRYEDLVTYCEFKGVKVSKSAIGRFGKRMLLLAKMKQAGVIAKDVMKGLSAEKASETQKAVAEMITAQTIEFISSNQDFTAKEIKEVAQAMKDCTLIAINADKYIRQQLAEKLKLAGESAKKKLTKAGVNRKLIQSIIDEHLGILKS
jgi:hypothetical protein